MEAEPLDVDTPHNEPGPVERVIETDDEQCGRRILVAIDQSRHSKHAFDWAITHFCRLGDTLHLLHVLPSKPEDISYSSSKESPPGLFEDISAFMEKLAVEAHEVAMVNTEVEIVGGDVGKMIVEIATRISPVAVVMGTTNCGVLKSLLQGSVSEYCSHHCPCPIVLVPPKEVGDLVSDLSEL